MMDTMITLEALEKLRITGYATLNYEEVNGEFETVLYIKEDADHIKLLGKTPKLKLGGELFNSDIIKVIRLKLLINENKDLYYSLWISKSSQNNGQAIIGSLRFQNNIKIKFMNKAGKIVKQYMINNSLIDLTKEYMKLFNEK
ncbi:hypothetical protein [Clostridium tagluense]|uniref:hypothetical protein n=1 Tax=Clostridium tagluense TaxID=360422 RepID=UPI001CF0E0C6|nr:hypothetical protein [Clostridium tagluense]MCB2299879.1 hypothetical protein [Clostridium tagluense]